MVRGKMTSSVDTMGSSTGIWGHREPQRHGGPQPHRPFTSPVPFPVPCPRPRIPLCPHIPPLLPPSLRPLQILLCPHTPPRVHISPPPKSPSPTPAAGRPGGPWLCVSRARQSRKTVGSDDAPFPVVSPVPSTSPSPSRSPPVSVPPGLTLARAANEAASSAQGGRPGPVPPPPPPGRQRSTRRNRTVSPK